MPAKIHDIHPHIISPDTVRYPVSPLGGSRSAWSTHRPVDFEQLIAGMDAAGISKAAIVHSSTTYGYDNTYVADAVSEMPDRFTGVFSVDVRAPDAVEAIHHWVRRGLSGLRLFAVGSTVKTDQSWIAGPDTYAAWEACLELGLPVAISMRQDGLPHLERVIERYPDVRIILDHLLHAPIDDGPPYPAAAPLFAMARYPNVYLKLTSAIVERTHQGLSTPPAFFAPLLSAFGSERVAWGSNYPAVEGDLPSITKASLATLACLGSEDQDNIFWRTAEGLYPALADG
jgi:L-fuconolactonase